MGLLNHACKVVRAGRSFLRRMIDTLHARPHATRATCYSLIRLNKDFRADLAWWQCFVKSWNGTSFLPTQLHLPQHTMASDASGHWGCGAWFHDRWFQVQWDATTSGLPITVKELLPILVPGIVWGRMWHGNRVVCLCDNQAVVACLHSWSSKHKGLMHLLCNLLFVEASFGFFFHPRYIDTHSNYLADDLSRNRTLSFLSKVPLASPYPTPACLRWRQRFSTIFKTV